MICMYYTNQCRIKNCWNFSLMIWRIDCNASLHRESFWWVIICNGFSRSERVNVRNDSYISLGLKNFDLCILGWIWQYKPYCKNHMWLYHCVFRTLSLSTMAYWQLITIRNILLAVPTRMSYRLFFCIRRSLFCSFRIPAFNSILYLYWLLAVMNSYCYILLQ